MNPGLTRPLEVGDRVWSKRFGYGQVIIVKQGDLTKYPYVVQFNHKNKESFSIEGIYQVSNPNTLFDLAGPLQEDETLESNKPIKIAQTITVRNKETGQQEGTIIDIDGCKIFRSKGSMVILPRNDGL